MMILVTGGSKCGKSRYAESLFADCTAQKYYLATMQPYGDEARSAIERHRKMRADKGFLTVEQYTDLPCANIPDGSAVLLECMGNLLANEMFRENPAADCAEKIVSEILRLYQKTSLLVIVTNQVGSDGVCYSAETAAYIAALGRINQALAATADRVIECVYGIPFTVKG